MGGGAAGTDERSLDSNMENGLKVLFLAAEVVPFAKTGGLADVAGALPKALKGMGHDIRVGMPRYGRIETERFGLNPAAESFSVPLDEITETVTVLQGTMGRDVPVYFVDNEKYFNREGIYGYPDDGERFVLYCRAMLEFVKKIGWKPDIIHCNDWHTGVVPNWLKTVYRDDPFFADTATVFTIHNLQYQGIFGHRILEIAGINEHGFLYHPEVNELANVVDLLARGVLFSDVINTVSERYAEEILTPEYGERLDPLLRDRKDRLFGVLNGIDYDELNPATDTHITVHYDVNSIDERIKNKLALQAEAGLPQDPDIPLIGAVSRLADQKGFDILGAIFDDMMKCLNVQFVLLGTGDQHYHNMFTHFMQCYPDKAAVFLTFNATLAQKIYAGSDMFLMPSRFEPCGLGQLISLRYGSIPIVRATGGLADTIHDFNPRTGEGNGFVFERYHSMPLYTAIVRALENFRYHDAWKELQRRGMEADLSWNASARRYQELYEKALGFCKAEAGGGVKVAETSSGS
jgi:starch synthase